MTVRYRHTFIFAAIVFLATGVSMADEPEHTKMTFTVVSFNIRYIVPSRPNDDWLDRREAVAGVLADMQADIIAFQEMETFGGGSYSDQNLQLEWVLKNFTFFSPGAVGDPKIFPVTQPILFDSRRLELVEQGFFFFSETPDEIYSRQWNGRYPYFCSWVKLRELNTEREFYVFNMHNDFASRRNRIRSTELVMKRIESINEDSLPLVLLGDFNAPASFAELRSFAEIGLSLVTPSGSTNRIAGLAILPAIDHILINSGFSADAPVRVWRNRYNGRYPSDHFPISVDLEFR